MSGICMASLILLSASAQAPAKISAPPPRTIQVDLKGAPSTGLKPVAHRPLVPDPRLGLPLGLLLNRVQANGPMPTPSGRPLPCCGAE